MVRVLDSITLQDEVSEPFRYARDAITHIEFSHDSKYLATAVSQSFPNCFKFFRFYRRIILPSICLFLLFFFNSGLGPFQDYFSSYETGQSVGGQKRENHEKNPRHTRKQNWACLTCGHSGARIHTRHSGEMS